MLVGFISVEDIDENKNC